MSRLLLFLSLPQFGEIKHTLQQSPTVSQLSGLCQSLNHLCLLEVKWSHVWLNFKPLLPASPGVMAIHFAEK